MNCQNNFWTKRFSIDRLDNADDLLSTRPDLNTNFSTKFRKKFQITCNSNGISEVKFKTYK